MCALSSTSNSEGYCVEDFKNLFKIILNLKLVMKNIQVLLFVYSTHYSGLRAKARFMSPSEMFSSIIGQKLWCTKAINSVVRPGEI